MSDERLRLLYQEMLSRRSAAEEAVSPEEMLALVEGRGSSDARLRTLDRVMRSEQSRREFELLRIAAAAARPRHYPRARVWAAAAAVLLMASASTLWLSWRPENALRGAGQSIVLSAPDDAPAVSGPLVFAWRRVPRATSYELELVDAGGSLVQMATLTDTSWTPPASLRLEPGVEYRWWVRATLVDGSILEAPPRRLVLSP